MAALVTTTTIAIATRTLDAPAVAPMPVRLRLTAPTSRPFAGGLRPQAGIVARVQQPVSHLISARGTAGFEVTYVAQAITVGAGTTAVRVQKNSDTRHSGTSVSRPPA